LVSLPIIKSNRQNIKRTDYKKKISQELILR